MIKNISKYLNIDEWNYILAYFIHISYYMCLHVVITPFFQTNYQLKYNLTYCLCILCSVI